jgi:tetratricopeptide (TPR) repeat protein
VRSSGQVARWGSSALILGLLSLTVAFGQDEEFASTFRKGTEALRAGDLKAAASAFTKCTVAEPAFAEAWLNLGLVRFQQNDLDAAIPALEKSLQLKPALLGANLFLGIARYRGNNYAAAAAALEREAQADPGNADALMWLGIVRLAVGSTADAVALLEKAAHMRPKDVDILYHLGRAYMLRSKETYERMYVADPKSWRVHQVLAQSFTDADRFDDAVKECQEAIRLKPAEPGLHQQLGDIYDRQNNLEMADAEYRNELKIDPHNAAVMYSLGVVSIERSKPADAVELLTEALRQAPGSVEARYQLGRAEAQLGHNDSAAVNFAGVVANPQRIDPEMLRQSYYQLAQLYRRLQRPEESRAALESFVRLKQQADTEQSHKLEDKLRKSVQAQGQ